MGIPVEEAGWAGFRGLADLITEPFSVPLLRYEAPKGHRCVCLVHTQLLKPRVVPGTFAGAQ